MGYKIAEIEGIGPAYAEKLAAANIATTDDLLKLCCTGDGRRAVAMKTGLSESQLLEWANRADLMRVKGIGSEFADLLEAAGVDTVKELAVRNGANLVTKLKEVNAQKKLTRATPSEKVVHKWISQAKQMPPMITH
jgi:predicted flap endonuclease-1-like 5' DNA nuclease